MGLEAVGSTAVLRTRLLSHYGLMRVKKFDSGDEETSQEVEVGIHHIVTLCAIILYFTHQLNFDFPKLLIIKYL